MATTFIPLKPEEMATFVGDDKAYFAYTDSLCYIEDMVLGYAPNRGHPRFDPDEAARMTRSILDGQLLSTYPAARENIRVNLFATEEIRQYAEAPIFQGIRLAEVDAEQFLDGLVKSYTELRMQRRYSTG